MSAEPERGLSSFCTVLPARQGPIRSTSTSKGLAPPTQQIDVRRVLGNAEPSPPLYLTGIRDGDAAPGRRQNASRHRLGHRTRAVLANGLAGSVR